MVKSPYEGRMRKFGIRNILRRIRWYRAFIREQQALGFNYARYTNLLRLQQIRLVLLRKRIPWTHVRRDASEYQAALYAKYRAPWHKS